MRYLVLSDVHANIDALEAVLPAARAVSYDRILVLGDLVGYCAEPNAVIDAIRALKPAAIIRGNHDKVALGIGDVQAFNPVAREAALWTRNAITPANLSYLAQLATGPLQVDDLVEVCHGSPSDEDAYVFDSLDALRALNEASRAICLFGHTHVPLVVCLDRSELRYEDAVDGGIVKLPESGRYLVNAGSVGQPRDGDPRAAFAVVDTGKREVSFTRVTYPIEKAQARIRRAGLPESLAVRLASGR